MTLRLTESIERTVWEACQVFQSGPWSREHQFGLGISLLLLKFFSDLADDKRESPDTVRRNFPLWDSLLIPPSCNWDKLLSRRSTSLPAHLASVLREIESSNEKTIGGAFKVLALGRSEDEIHPNLMYSAIAHLSRLNLRPSHLDDPVQIGEAYERLLERFADSWASTGEYFVPREVSLLMAKLVTPKQGESIYDPFCRSGQLLACLGRHAKKPSRLVGQARSSRDTSFSRLNLLLHGLDKTSIETADAIWEPLVDTQGNLSKFDVIVSNPPFNLSNWGGERVDEDPFSRFTRGAPPENRADYAFISHIVESMHHETGRSAVVVSLGALFRSGIEASIRRKFIEENLLHAVVVLPENLFVATKISVALMIFKRKRAYKNILFIDASQSFTTKGRRNALSNHDIERVVDAFKHARLIEGFSRSVSIEEVIDNDFNLRSSLYISRKERAAKPVDELWAETQPIEEELGEVREELDRLMRKLGFFP